MTARDVVSMSFPGLKRKGKAPKKNSVEKPNCFLECCCCWRRTMNV